MQQRGIDAGESRDHAGIGLVALSGAGVDDAELPRVGDDDLMAEALEEAAGPRAVRSDFEGNAAGWILQGKPPQGLLVIGDRTLVDDFTRMVEDANGVLLVPEIKADGDVRYRVHGSGEFITLRKRSRSLPSHLILLDLCWFGDVSQAGGNPVIQTFSFTGTQFHQAAMERRFYTKQKTPGKWLVRFFSATRAKL